MVYLRWSKEADSESSMAKGSSSKPRTSSATSRGQAKSRPKATDSASVPRAPSRTRGKLRYQALIEATEALLSTDDPGSVGLYQIAEKAAVPPASVYHFFPTKEAAFLALAQQYVDQILQLLAEPIEAASFSTWPEFMRIDMRRGADFHNAHPPMMKINYGGFGGVETRHVDELFAMQISSTQYARMNKVFHMPHMRNPAEIFEMRLAIIDGIYGISYRRHGMITDRYFDEAHKAVVAFISQFLPPRLELRQSWIEAAERGEHISLPFEDADNQDGNQNC